MAFQLPPETKSTAALLRELEQSAPNPTPKAIRAAMIQAAQELEAHTELAHNAARQLEEAANVRISAMASDSNVQEIQRGVKATMLELARQFRDWA